MARVQVVSDDGATVVPIVLTGIEGDYTEGACPCGEVISVRGQFENTVRQVQIHLDRRH